MPFKGDLCLALNAIQQAICHTSSLLFYGRDKRLSLSPLWKCFHANPRITVVLIFWLVQCEAIHRTAWTLSSHIPGHSWNILGKCIIALLVGDKSVFLPKAGSQCVYVLDCPWKHLLPSLPGSPLQHTGRGRAKLRVHKKNKNKNTGPGRKQSPPKCVSLWKKRKESELSILVKDIQAFPKQPVIMG